MKCIGLSMKPRFYFQAFSYYSVSRRMICRYKKVGHAGDRCTADVYDAERYITNGVIKEAYGLRKPYRPFGT